MRILESLIEDVGFVVEAVGVAVIVLGAALASVLALARFGSLGPAKTYAAYRVGLARSILVGLELLVAGDIIRTVVVAPTLENIGLLATVVVIRTFLSFTLELEVTGRFPWQRTGGSEQRDREV